MYVPCGYLLGKGWPLGSRLWCLTVSLSLFYWYPGSDVVLDCIDSYFFAHLLTFIRLLRQDSKISTVWPLYILLSPDNLSRDVSSHSKPNLSLFAGSKRVFA